MLDEPRDSSGATPDQQAAVPETAAKKATAKKATAKKTAVKKATATTAMATATGGGRSRTRRRGPGAVSSAAGELTIGPERRSRTRRGSLDLPR